MHLTGEFSFEALPEEVWQVLMDPEVLRSMLPGTERLEQLDDSHFNASWRVKIGPIVGAFTGSIELSNVQPPVSCHMTSVGRGSVGGVSGEADFQLRAEGEATVLTYDLDVRITGRLANIGQRLVESSMRSLIRSALGTLSERIQERVKDNTSDGSRS